MVLGLLLASGGHYDLFSCFCLCGHIVISYCFTSYDKCTYCKSLWMKASAKCPKCKFLVFFCAPVSPPLVMCVEPFWVCHLKFIFLIVM